MSNGFNKLSRKPKRLKKVQNVECRAKGYQAMALLEHGNTICRAHWDKEQIIEAFKKRDIDVEVYRPSYDYIGGAEIYILVNRNHERYEYITGGMQGVKI